MADKVFITVERFFDHPIEDVFSRYTDHASWGDWSRMGRVWLVREGAPERNGVGAIRGFSRTPGLREEVTVFEPPTRMEYRIVSGPVPVTDHRGEVVFTPEGWGTRVTWRVSFQPTLPAVGWFLRHSLGFVFKQALAGLGRDLDRRR